MEEDATGMAQISDLRHGLLSGEASLLQLDRPIEAPFDGQVVVEDVHADPGDALHDPPGLEVLG
jgi:hypothetical protein